ncbi:immunoglobulin I-set domain protein, partial [Teladorsagia circumcincta]
MKKDRKLREEMHASDVQAGTPSQIGTSNSPNEGISGVSGESHGVSKLNDSIGATTEALHGTSKKRAVSENVKLARSMLPAMPQLPVIFSEEEGSATDSEESSSVVYYLSISNTVKVAETFVISAPQPQQIAPVEESSAQKKTPVRKPKPSNIKYLSDETEKLLKMKAKMSEKAVKDSEIIDSENDFGELSTDQMADFATDSDATIEQSDNEVFKPRRSQPTSALKRSKASEALNESTMNEANYRAPVFRIKKQTIKCTEGHPLAVKAFISAYPEPSISVYHNDDLISGTESLVKEGDNLYSFTFSVDSAHVEDSGKVTIKAKNQLGSDEFIAHIDVLEETKQRYSKYDLSTFEREFEAAEITTSIADVAVIRGETARLQGKVCGYPIPEMIWLKNGIEFDPTLHPDKYNVDVYPDGTFTMKIADCTPDDDDVYALLVENMAGIDSCDFQVFVVERANPRATTLAQGSVAPHFESILSDQDAVEGEKVVMMVTTQGAPPPDVRFYRDGKLICDDEKYEIRHEAKSNTHWLILKNAEKTEEAEYACQAVNAAGEAWCYSDLTVRSADKAPATDAMGKAETTQEAESEEKSPDAGVLSENSDDRKGMSTLLQKSEPEGIEAKSKLSPRKQKNQKKEASERMDSELYGESRNKDETSGAESKEVLAETTWGTPGRTFDEQTPVKVKENKQLAKDESDEAHHRAKIEKVKKADPGDKKSSAVSCDDSVPVAAVMESKADQMKGDEAAGKEEGTAAGSQPNQKGGKKDVEKLEKRETSKAAVGPTRREPSPDAAGKKKKSIPKALLIPAQISSRFGDPSTEGKSTLPPKHAKKVVKKKIEGKVPSESIHEKTVASEEGGPTGGKGTLDSQPSELVVEAHEKHQSEIEPMILDGSRKDAEMSVASRSSDAALYR